MTTCEKQAIVDCIVSRATEILNAHEAHRTPADRAENLYPVFLPYEEIGDVDVDMPWGRAGALDKSNVYEQMSDNVRRAQSYCSIERVIRDASIKTNPIRYNPYIRYTSNMKDLRLLKRLTVDHLSAGLMWDFIDENDHSCQFTPVQMALAYILWKTGFQYLYVTEVVNMDILRDALPELDPKYVDSLSPIKICNRANRGTQLKILSLPPGQGKTNIAINALLAILASSTLDRIFAQQAAASEACDRRVVSLMNVSVDSIFTHVVVVVAPNNVYGHWHRRLQNECTRRNILCYPKKVKDRFTNSEVHKIFETCSRPKGYASVSGDHVQTAVILLNPKQFSLLEKCQWIRNSKAEYAWPLTVMDEISSHVDDMCRKVVPNCLQLWGITATPTDTFMGRSTGYMYQFMWPASRMERAPNSLLLECSKRKRRGKTSNYDPSERLHKEFAEVASGNTYWMCLSVVAPYMETWILEDHAMYMPMGINSIKYGSPASACSPLAHKVFSHLITNSSDWYTQMDTYDTAPKRFEINLMTLGVTRSKRQLEGGDLGYPLARSYGVPFYERTTILTSTLAKEHATRISRQVRADSDHRIVTVWDLYIFTWIAVDKPCTFMGASSLMSNVDIAITNLTDYVNDLQHNVNHSDYKLLGAARIYLFHLEALRTTVQDTVPIWMESEEHSGSKDGSSSFDILLMCMVCGGQVHLNTILRSTWFIDYCEWSLISDDVGADQECLIVSVHSMRCPCCSWKLIVEEAIRPIVDMTATTHFHMADLLSREAREEWTEAECEAATCKLRTDLLENHVQLTQGASSHAEFKMEKLFGDGLQSCYDRHEVTSFDQCGAFFTLDCYLHNAIFRFDCKRVLIFYRGDNCLAQFSEVLRVLNSHIPYDKTKPSTSTCTGASRVSARSLTEGMKRGKSYRSIKDENSSWFLENTSDVRIMYLLAQEGGLEETHGLNLNNTDLIIFYGPGANLVQSISRGLRMSVQRQMNRKVLNVFHMS
ncbi:hypothetical protein CYMTET_44625 [Cymbomonas tetramitiformis]|uniref:Uncharacterized protein n=1 Tax=Cymbomonas tetramitiformis TaxID=36881 RepID=A0AAE0C111_9CHLO|nr:hypothetical protein CYMTET_44625 [Cymbomonas tetramitiformis]